MNWQDQAATTELRNTALRAESEAQTSLMLSQLWRHLRIGSTCVVDSFFTDERAYLVLTQRLGQAVSPTGERWSILEDVLCANAQKLVAFERALAASTIAANAKSCLRYLGLGCNPSRVPPLLLLAARAARDEVFDRSLRLGSWAEDPLSYWVVSVVRPERCLMDILSDAEFEVVRALVEGCSHTEIARGRGTSPRTIANQLATAFRRLGVSSRGELLHRLSERALAEVA
jgi:DNA-binding CsgD family transcriptional regulator